MKNEGITHWTDDRGNVSCHIECAVAAQERLKEEVTRLREQKSLLVKVILDWEKKRPGWQVRMHEMWKEIAREEP